MSRNITHTRGKTVKRPWLENLIMVLFVGAIVGGGCWFVSKKFEDNEKNNVVRDKNAITREKAMAKPDETFAKAAKRFETQQEDAAKAQAKRDADSIKFFEAAEKRSTDAQTKRDGDFAKQMAKLGEDAEKSAAARDKAATLREAELGKKFDAQLKQLNDAQTKRDAEQLKVLTKLGEDAEKAAKAADKTIEGLKTQMAALETAAGKRDAAAQKRMDELLGEVAQIRAAHATAVAEAKKLGDQLVKATAPKVGLYDEPVLEVIEEYGGKFFFILYNRNEEVPPPDTKIIDATRQLYEAVLGVKETPFTGKLVIEAMDDRGLLPEGTKKAKYWRVAYERKEDRGLAAVVGKEMIQPATPKSMFVYRTGVVVTWTRKPEDRQVERLTPHLRNLLELTGFKPGALSGWHDARTYVFAP